ncbi:MAG: bifunctional tetrahydrofolate synthase/dihydrofolate synthase [Gammaproteobacteria bacterium]|nr:bifunctional tetrahydrofolate synthase/dihydrofolate synthase [Gammaproteobacteria bacterium]
MLQPDIDDSLQQWLAWLEHLHPVEIELGLERVAAVARRANLTQGLPPVVTVAGTNGKGSVVAVISAIYTAAGYKTGAYTSPHLVHFNERIRIDGQCAADSEITAALAFVDRHREPESLTYFESTTLAAMRVFLQADVDIVVLEVGLGGRLDAVNIWDTHCAVVTSIAIDHESWLGSDRNTIAAEKAAIARQGRPLIVAETDPPESLLAAAQTLQDNYWQVGVDYQYDMTGPGDNWQVRTPVREHNLASLSLPGVHQFGNCAAAIAAIDALNHQLPVPASVISQTVTNVGVVGRLDRYTEGGVEILLDVAHNPAAARVLAYELDSLRSTSAVSRVHAVFAVMADKDVAQIIAAVAPGVDTWHCGQLAVGRALSAEALASQLQTSGETDVFTYASVPDALQGARDLARHQPEAENRNTDLVLVFGSFFTVSEVLSLRESN